jgi:uncharacterized protein
MSENTHGTNTLKTVVIISILINVILALGIVLVYSQQQILKDQVKEIADTNNDLNSELISLKNLYNISQEHLEYYQRQAEYYSQLSKVGRVGTSLEGYAKIDIVAVRQVPVTSFSTGYEGVILTAEIELREGEGRTLINTQPKIGIDMQTSLRTAVTVAENMTGISLESTDVLLTIRGKESVEIVDGPSAGVAVTSALIAAMTNTTLRHDVHITGTINPDGTIGRVGGILEKANASAELGTTLFLIPKGQRMLMGYKPIIFEPIPGFQITTYEPYEIDLVKYLDEKGFYMEVLEVSTIDEVYLILKGES